MAKEPILSAKDVEIQFSLRGRKLMAIRKCSLDLYEGETLAIVGESGSGKSVFTKSFIGMLDANGSIVGGSITYDGVDISKYKTEKEWLQRPRRKAEKEQKSIPKRRGQNKYQLHCQRWKRKFDSFG